MLPYTDEQRRFAKREDVGWKWGWRHQAWTCTGCGREFRPPYIVCYKCNRCWKLPFCDVCVYTCYVSHVDADDEEDQKNELAARGNRLSGKSLEHADAADERERKNELAARGKGISGISLQHAREKEAHSTEITLYQMENDHEPEIIRLDPIKNLD